jgi:hypothetical protein
LRAAGGAVRDFVLEMEKSERTTVFFTNDSVLALSTGNKEVANANRLAFATHQITGCEPLQNNFITCLFSGT